MDLERLNSYVDQINKVKNMDLSKLNPNKEGTYRSLAYAKALKEVESSQAALLLSTQGLTNAEIRQVLAHQGLTKELQYEALSNAGLLKSKQSLTVADVKATLQSKLGSQAKMEETLKSMGLSAAIDAEEKQTIELTAEKIRLAVASGKLTEAQALELASHWSIAGALDAQNKDGLPKWLANLKATGSALKVQVKDTIAWAKALPLATKALAGAGIGIGAAIIAYSAYKKNLEEVRVATDDAATAYKDSSSSIDEYVEKYQNLQNELKEARGNEKETLRLKQELLALQQELNDKFGDEYGRINLVTNAYKNQTDALKTLNEEEAKKFLNENRKGIDKATKEMTKERTYTLSLNNISSESDSGKALQELIDEYKDEGMSLVDGVVDGTYEIKLNATADEAYDIINRFENDVRNLAKELGNDYIFDNVLDVSSKALNKAKEKIDDYGNIYSQALMANLVTDEDASKVYENAITAVEEYNQAVLESENPYNDEKVAKAKANVEAVKSEVNRNQETLGQFSSLFEDVFDQADTRLLDFNEKFKTDTTLKEFAEQLRGLETVDLESMANDDLQDAFDELVSSAEEYELGVSDVIDALIRLGYVQGDIANTDPFSDNTISLDTLNKQIDSIQSAFKGLTTACEEYNKYGYITADTLQTLLSLDGQYLACLINENGQLAINGETYEKLVQAKLADAEATAVQQAIEELGKITSEQKAQADVVATQVTFEKAKALAALSGSYGAVATSAAAAAQAEALYNAYESASGINAEEADRIMTNLNTKLALIQNTAKKTSGSFGALTNHLNGFTNATGKATDATDKFIESLKKTKEKLEAERDEYDSLYSAITWFYDKQLDGLDDEIDGLQKVVDLLEKQRDNLDDVMSAMKTVYKSEIDSLQDKADALDKTNEKAEVELRLEEAKRKLLEARSRKTKLLYQKGIGFTYVQDQKSIKDAETELEEANAEKVKQGIKDQIDIYQSYIDKLDEIPDAYERAMQKVAASKYLGTDWATAILNPSDDLFKNLESDYTGIESNIAKNEDRIDSIEKEKERIEELKKLWSDAKNAYEYAENEARLKAFFGSDYEYQLLNNSAKWRRKFADEYSSICSEIASLEKQIQAASEETASAVESSVGKVANTFKETGNLSKYLWTDEDELALEKAYERLDALNLLVERGGEGYVASRDTLAEFIAEYEHLKESGEITDELRAKTIELNDEYSLLYGAVGSIGEGLATRLGIFDTSTESIVSNVQGISKSVSDADSALQGAKTAEAEIATDTSNIVTDIQGRTATLAKTSEQLRQNLEGAKTAEAEIENQTLDTMSGIQERQITIVGASAELKENLDGIVSSETEVEQTADETVSNVETTISNLITKLGDFKIALGDVKLSRDEVEMIADEELVDTTEIVDGVHTKVSEIQSAVEILTGAISTLQGSLDGLVEKLHTVDEFTLSNVIGAFGGVSGGDEKDSSSGSSQKKQSSGKNESGSDGGGSGLLGAVNNVITALGESGSDGGGSGLLGKLSEVNNSPLDTIIARFGLGDESDGSSLLDAVNSVSRSILGEDEDEMSLISRIENLGSETTVGHVNTVTSSFEGLLKQIESCISKLEELAEKIKSLPSSTASVGVNGGSVKGRAKGGIITKKDSGDLDYIARSIGEDHTIAVQEGEAVIPKETVSANAEIIQMLLNAGSSEIKTSTPNLNSDVFERMKIMGVVPQVAYSVPEYSKNFMDNQNISKKISISFGDIHVHDVQNVNSFANELITNLERKMTQQINKRDF